MVTILEFLVEYRS